MDIIDDNGYGQYVDLSTSVKTNIVNKYHNHNHNHNQCEIPNKNIFYNECNSFIVKPTILIELSKYFRVLSRPEVFQLCLSPIIIIALYILYFVYSSVE